MALVLSVAGCSAAGSAGNPTPTATATPTPTVTTVAWTLDSARAVIQASYDLYEKVGVTETSVWNGETSKLIFDPTAGDYQAAYRNETTGEQQLIFEAYAFSVFNASLAIDDKSLKFETTKDGFSLTTNEGGKVNYLSDGKLLTGAYGASDDVTWSSQIVYEVDPAMREVLAQLTKELLAG